MAQELRHNNDVICFDWSPLVGFPGFRSHMLEAAIAHRARLFPTDTAFQDAVATTLKQVENLRAGTDLFRRMTYFGELPELAAELDSEKIESYTRYNRLLMRFYLHLCLTETDRLLGRSSGPPVVDTAWAKEARAVTTPIDPDHPFITDSHRDGIAQLERYIRDQGLLAEIDDKPLQ